jgi:PAS domain S-box-containing protein
MAGKKRKPRHDGRTQAPGFSIGGLFVIALSLFSVLFLAAWVTLESLTAAARMRSRLNADLELTADRLASSLALNLWDINYPQADAIALAAMGDKNVLSIEVVPAVRGHAPRIFARDGEWKAVGALAVPEEKGSLLASREILANGKRVGSLRLALTPRFAEAELQEATFRLGIAVGGLDFLIFGLLLALLWFLVLKPLRTVGAYAVEVSLGRPAVLPPAWPGREISALSSAIATMVGLLENRYREAEASERRYKVLFEHAPDAILELDLRTGAILSANAAAVSLFGPGASGGAARIFDFCQEEECASTMGRSLQAAERGESADFERRMKRADGSATLCAMGLTPLPAGAGMRTARLSCVDVGEKRDLEDRLRHAERLDAIGQLAGGVAHDFNNQLAGILGYAELISDRLEKGEEKDWAMGIVKSATRAAGLTRQLLAYARRGTFAREAVDVHALCRETAGFLERSIDKRIRIRLDLDAPDSVVEGDSSQLQNAILNLSINARDAMGEGGTLTISTAPARPEALSRADLPPDAPRGAAFLEVAVTDTGTGMDDETKKHLFEPFFTTKGPGKGTGLGLAAVYGTAKRHGGTILVDSAVGQGTRMALLLPLLGKGQNGALIADPEAGLEFSGGIVILVDDEEMIREVGKAMLEDLGFEPIVCWDAESALQAFSNLEGRPCLVILDMIMPGSSGKEIFAALRAVDPEARVIISSGYAVDGDAQDMLDTGAAGFLHKPFSKAEFKAALERALGKTGDRVSGS